MSMHRRIEDNATYVSGNQVTVSWAEPEAEADDDTMAKVWTCCACLFVVRSGPVARVCSVNT